MRQHVISGSLRPASVMLLSVVTAACAATSAPRAVPASAAQAPAGAVPALADMLPATISGKMGVAVDLRYSFEAAVQTGQPVTLHLAAIPQVSGSNLSVSIKSDPAIRTTAGEMYAQKATARSAYRQQLSVTRLADGASSLRVLVTMDMPIGSAFGYFGIPLDGAPVSATKPVQPDRIE